MPMPNIPMLEKFLVCLEVPRGVMYTSGVLAVLWIVNVLQAILTLGSGQLIWNVIWGVANIVVYGLVVYTIWKDKGKMLLLPAIFVSLFDIVVCIINAILLFISLFWFSAIWVLIIAAITIYYFLGLYTVYRQGIPSGGEPAAGDIKMPA